MKEFKKIISSHTVVCSGALTDKRLNEPVHALLRVYTNGEVKVNCLYFDRENCRAGDYPLKCIYLE